MPQTSFRTTDKQQAIIDKAILIVGILDGKSYGKKAGLLRICDKLAQDTKDTLVERSGNKTYAELMKPD